MTPVQQHMAQGGSTAASEAAQAAAAAAAAVGNSTLFTHMAHIRGHEPGGEVNLSQDQSENIHGKASMNHLMRLHSSLKRKSHVQCERYLH